MKDGQAVELARQRALLALLAADETPALVMAPGAGLPRDIQAQACGLQAGAATSAGVLAYRRNARATARRVLRANFPTILAMLGEEALDAIALLLWRLSPPQGGDLGEWGAALPDLLARHPDLQAWPWLADSARMDWARHACERAADARLDAASLQRLGDTEPERLQLLLVPGLCLLASRWPLLALWQAHEHAPGAAPSGDARTQAQAQAALAALSTHEAAKGPDAAGNGVAADGERHVLVWRGADWRINMAELPQAWANWMQALLDATRQDDPPSLSKLLAQAPADLDFSAWLNAAVRDGWLWRVDVLSGRGAG